jgi:hypothetical protein
MNAFKQRQPAHYRGAHAWVGEAPPQTRQSSSARGDAPSPAAAYSLRPYAMSMARMAARILPMQHHGGGDELPPIARDRRCRTAGHGHTRKAPGAHFL